MSPVDAVSADVAVIVPCRDDLPTLARALASIAAQGVAHELVVVDDGSATPLTADDLPPGCTLLRTVGVGPGAARNAGVAASSATWVAFLDADDRWAPDCLAQQLTAADRGSAEGLPPEVVWGRTNVHRAAGDDRPDAVAHITQVGSLLVRRDAFRRMGGFAVDIRASEDLDLVWRMQRSGVAILRHDGVVTHFEQRSGSFTDGGRRGTTDALAVVRHRMQQRRDAMSVGVVMAVRNGMPWLPVALRSVTEQEPAPLDVVVIDGNSTDRTHDVLDSTSGVRWKVQSRPGLYAAFNEGLDMLDGEWIAFCGCDDEWLPGRLDRQLAAAGSSPEADLVLGATEFVEIEPGGGIAGRHLAGTSRVAPILESMLVRRSLVDRVGRFDEQFSVASDLPWIQAALHEARQVVECPDVVLRKGLHRANTSNRTAMTGEMLSALRSAIHRQRE